MGIDDDLAALREELDALRSDTTLTTSSLHALAGYLHQSLVTIHTELETMGTLLNGATLRPAPAPAPAPRAAIRPRYGDLRSWVDQYLYPRIESRLVRRDHWKATWHQQPEVSDRLHALWQSWERARASGDPTDLGRWYTDHFDKHVTEIIKAQDMACETVGEWVTDILLPSLERRVSNTRRWCNAWNEHREVVQRFSALWQSWEQARRDGEPSSMSSWYTDHLDRHLTVIFSADGPFAGCSPQRHSPRRQLDGQIPRSVDQTKVGPGFALSATTPDTFYDLDDEPDDIGGITDDRTQEVRAP